jgi:hypothetical protein
MIETLFLVLGSDQGRREGLVEPAYLVKHEERRLMRALR